MKRIVERNYFAELTAWINHPAGSWMAQNKNSRKSFRSVGVWMTHRLGSAHGHNCAFCGHFMVAIARTVLLSCLVAPKKRGARRKVPRAGTLFWGQRTHAAQTNLLFQVSRAIRHRLGHVKHCKRCGGKTPGLCIHDAQGVRTRCARGVCSHDPLAF